MSELKSTIESIKPADINDLPGLFGVLEIANLVTLQKSGIRTWPNIEASSEDITQHVLAEEVFVIRDSEGGVMSTITLCETNPEWSEAARDDPALYFTKFMRDPAKTKPGDGKPLLIFAVQEAERRGKPTIRCDALIEEVGMIAYYKALGFEEKGRTVYQLHGREGVLLETATADLKAHLNN